MKKLLMALFVLVVATLSGLFVFNTIEANRDEKTGYANAIAKRMSQKKV